MIRYIVKISLVITSFAVSAENILSIRIFDGGVRRVGDVMCGINEQE